jgi:hypothetical protein
MSTIAKVAKQMAESNSKLPKAYKYDLVMREFDNKVELIGLVDDPTYDIADFSGREMLFPKKWVTLDVFELTTKVTV